MFNSRDETLGFHPRVRPPRGLSKSTGTGSAERRFRVLCQRHGLPEPRPQLIEGHRVDFYWPEARLAIEVDGVAFH